MDSTQQTNQKNSASQRLFTSTVVENKDEIEEKLQRHCQNLQTITSGLSDKDAHDALQVALAKEKGYEEVSLGLLVSILTEPANAAKSYRDLTLITRDGWGLIFAHLNPLVLERYLRLTEVAKSQLIWLVREMIRNAVPSVDTVCINLMRHAAGGDISPKNIFLVESLLDTFIEHRIWLEKYSHLIPPVVYNYLRLIEDHNAPFLLNLRQKEVSFVVSLLRERFNECAAIGRDLVRLLQNVARIPEFEKLWRDILTNPRSLSPNFSGVLQLLQTRTSRRFLQFRLTPDMEKKLVFLTSQVRFGNHKRYQDWFQRQYLATPESQSLRCDMIRFIVGVIHPTNELLCSEIIPRWAVIGWLLTTCTSTVAVSNAKLALFYDWLFFDSEKDNIMNIEPAILVMHHSLRSHPAVSATLLDFLCRIISNFYPPLTDKVRNGIFSSLRQILDKRVLPSLVPLFDNNKLDRELKNMVRATFKEFCVSQPETSKEDNDMKMEPGTDLLNNHLSSMEPEPAFSDDEDEGTGMTIHTEDDTDDDDIPLANIRIKKESGDVIEGPLKTELNKYQAESDIDKKCVCLESVLDHLTAAHDEESDVIPALAKVLCASLDELKFVFPSVINEQTLQESIKFPLFTIFKYLYKLCQTCENDEDAATSKQVILKLLAEMHSIHSNVGYFLLYFLKIHVRTDPKNDKCSALKTSVYKDFCQLTDKKVDGSLYDDLTACHVEENGLTMFIVPDLYRDYKQQTVNNAQILRVILSTLDSNQLQDLIAKIMQGRLLMFKSDNIQTLLKASLKWESIEQYFLWQLIQAHDISLDAIVPLLSYLDYKQHSEALTALTLMLKQEKPTADYMKYLFSRDVREVGDPVVFTIIKHWCVTYMEKVGELVASLLSTRYPATSPNKRKRSNNKSLSSTVPSADQVLGHLEHLRISCEKYNILGFYHLDPMQKALQVACNNSTESQKKQFGELFALSEEPEEVIAKSKSSGRGRKAVAKQQTKRPAKDISESSEDTSEEEEFVKPKQAKKRKKVVLDSD